MSDTACCACLRVEYAPLQHDDGSMSERWKCLECGSTFARQFFIEQYKARAAELEQGLETATALQNAAVARAEKAEGALARVTEQRDQADRALQNMMRVVAENEAMAAEVERLRAWLEHINANAYDGFVDNMSDDALEGKPAPTTLATEPGGEVGS